MKKYILVLIALVSLYSCDERGILEIRMMFHISILQRMQQMIVLQHPSFSILKEIFQYLLP